MQGKWNLDDIYKGFDSPEFLADFDSVGGLVKQMNDLSEKIESFDEVKKLVGMLEEIISIASRIGAYSSFVYTTDTSDQGANKYTFQLRAITAEAARARVRLSAFLAKDPGSIKSLAEKAGIGEYVWKLEEMAKDFAHMMSEDEETLVSQLSNTGSGAWVMLQSKLISTLTCEYADPTDGGKARTIGINEARNLAYHQNPEVRKAAYEAEISAYPKIAESCAAAINGIKGEVNLLTGKRNYESPLAKTLRDSQMTRKTLDAMFMAIDENIQFFRDYLRAKAAYLTKGEKKGLPFYDLFAPVGLKSDKELSYDEAKALVLANFTRFSPEMERVAKLSFDNEWIDVYPREGKVSGAYCGSVYAIKQFRILLNYGNSLSDAITLAHELGHGYHAIQIMQEKILNTTYPMPLAETASTFCEAILTNAALETLQGDEKLQLIENSISDATQVLVDIYSRYLFETYVFETRADHPLSVDELNDAMLDAQKKAYGNGLDEDILHKYMWVVKPHYYSASMNFYNFPYAFGHLLANGLYGIYQKDPDTFEAKYISFLRSTGKMPIKESCMMLGIDVEDVKFWKDSIDVIKQNIASFMELAKVQ